MGLPHSVWYVNGNDEPRLIAQCASRELAQMFKYHPYNTGEYGQIFISEDVDPIKHLKQTTILPAVTDIATYTSLLTIAAKAWHLVTVQKGWYSDLTDLTTGHVSMGDKLLSVVGNLTKALEGYIKGLKDTQLLHRSAFDVGIASALIGILDIAGYMKVNLAQVTREKMEYDCKKKA